jgi:hypothetical protein
LDEETVSITRDLGYKTAVTCTPGPARRDDDPFFLRRVAVPAEMVEFQWVIESALVGRAG